MMRYGMVIKVRAEKLEEYKELHSAVWPNVLEMIKKCNIHNYSIYHKDVYPFLHSPLIYLTDNIILFLKLIYGLRILINQQKRFIIR